MLTPMTKFSTVLAFVCFSVLFFVVFPSVGSAQDSNFYEIIGWNDIDDLHNLDANFDDKSTKDGWEFESVTQLATSSPGERVLNMEQNTANRYFKEFEIGQNVNQCVEVRPENGISQFDIWYFDSAYSYNSLKCYDDGDYWYCNFMDYSSGWNRVRYGADMPFGKFINVCFEVDLSTGETRWNLDDRGWTEWLAKNPNVDLSTANPDHFKYSNEDTSGHDLAIGDLTSEHFSYPSDSFRGFSMPDDRYCQVGTSCPVYVDVYDDDLEGFTLHVVDVNNPWPDYSLGSTSIQNIDINSPFKININAANTVNGHSSTSPDEYCIFGESPQGFNDISSCQDWFIEWTLDDQYAVDEDVFSEYDLESACDDVATSTGTFDDFRYGIECGIRKVAYWAFVPKQGVQRTMRQSVEQFRHTFPISLAYRVEDVAKSARENTDNQVNLTYGEVVPSDWVQQSGYGSSTVLSSEIVTNNVHEEAWNTIQDSISWAIYLLVSFYIIVRLYKSYNTKRPSA